MKFEVLKKDNLKRNIIIGGCVVLIISAVVLNFTRAKYRSTASVPIVDSEVNYSRPDLEIIALYIDGVQAEELDSNTNYTLDTTNSTCTYKDGTAIDNLTLNYDSETGSLSISPFTTRGTKCILYFNEVQELRLDVSIASIRVEEGSTPDTLYVSGGGLEEQIEVSNNAKIVISGSSSLNSIILNGNPTNIVFNNIDITQSGLSGISIMGSVTVNLVGDNYASSSSIAAAPISVTGNSELIINGDGSLTATGGGYAAAIGGNGVIGTYGDANEVVGNITINSGVINATGGSYAAAIGGGANQVNGVITINGGTVNATAGAYAAAIGTGASADIQGNGNCIPLTPNSIYINEIAIINATTTEGGFDPGTSDPILGNAIGSGGACGCV